MPRNSFFSFLASRTFILNILGILAMFLLAGIITLVWLRVYTNHGQQLDLPDFEGMQIEDARKNAEMESFTLSVKDSIHVVGEQGGKILQQEPPPGSKVKAGRSVYVTITKNEPDRIQVSRLPVLYGENFDRKKKELFESFELRSTVIGKEYDPGVPGQILEVRYQGQPIINASGRNDGLLLEKGATLEFIISERSGGVVAIPDIVCQEYAAAKFALESIGLSIGEIRYADDVFELAKAFIIRQSPGPDRDPIQRGSKINIEVSAEKPIDCEGINE